MCFQRGTRYGIRSLYCKHKCKLTPKRGGSRAATLLVLICTYFPEASITPVLSVKLSYLLLMSLFPELNIDFKAVERLHQEQWQLSCHQSWCKVPLIFVQCRTHYPASEFHSLSIYSAGHRFFINGLPYQSYDTEQRRA